MGDNFVVILFLKEQLRICVIPHDTATCQVTQRKVKREVRTAGGSEEMKEAEKEEKE